MPRMIAFLCNDDNLTPVALRSVRDSLELPVTGESAGFGFGWLQDGRTLLRTTPKPSPSSGALLDLMTDIRSRALIGHVRERSDGPVDTLDLQPFRLRSWLFAHCGEDVGLDQAHEQLLGEFASFVSANIKGTTSSEVFGHVFLGELVARSLLDAHTDRRGVAAALAAAIRRIQVGAAVADFAAIAISDRTIVAGSIGHALRYREVRGLSQPHGEPLFAGHKPKPARHPTFKGIVVTDGPVRGDEWQPIPDGQVLWVDRDWTARFEPVAE